MITLDPPDHEKIYARCDEIYAKMEPRCDCGFCYGVHVDECEKVQSANYARVEATKQLREEGEIS